MRLEIIIIIYILLIYNIKFNKNYITFLTPSNKNTCDTTIPNNIISEYIIESLTLLKPYIKVYKPSEII